MKSYRGVFKTIQRNAPVFMKDKTGDVYGYYKKVRDEINKILGLS